MKNDTPLSVSIDDGIATITFNRPDTYNLLTLEMLTALHESLLELESDTTARVIILTGSGPAFSAGHDLRALEDSTQQDMDRLFTLCTETMEQVRLFPKPIIAQIQGNAVAAGFQLVCSCDLVVASEKARFGATGIKAGLFCSTPMIPFSRAVTGKKALEILLLGDMVDGHAMEEMGLVNHVVPHENLGEFTRTLAARIAQHSPYVLALGKAAYYKQRDMPMAEAYQVGQQAMVRNILSEDGQEGIKAFLQKRTPAYSKD